MIESLMYRSRWIPPSLSTNDSKPRTAFICSLVCIGVGYIFVWVFPFSYNGRRPVRT